MPNHALNALRLCPSPSCVIIFVIPAVQILSSAGCLSLPVSRIYRPCGPQGGTPFKQFFINSIQFYIHVSDLARSIEWLMFVTPAQAHEQHPVTQYSRDFAYVPADLCLYQPSQAGYPGGVHEAELIQGK